MKRGRDESEITLQGGGGGGGGGVNSLSTAAAETLEERESNFRSTTCENIPTSIFGFSRGADSSTVWLYRTLHLK